MQRDPAATHRPPVPDSQDCRVGIVRARFNDDVTQAMEDACREELLSLGLLEINIESHTVPGALEIPVALQAMAMTEEFDALIAIGCVIRGDTYHFELVCNESASGITRVALDRDIPIANAVLTVENPAQAWDRVEGKSRDAAHVAVEMIHLLNRLA